VKVTADGRGKEWKARHRQAHVVYCMYGWVRYSRFSLMMEMEMEIETDVDMLL